MAAPAFIGDELSAAGFRLAGAQVRIPEPGQETAALVAALADAPLVLVSAEVAARIEPAMMRDAIASRSPLVAIVPDAQGEVAVPDLAARLRTQLGLAG
jgi:vacuolar-type H+-ATPase subunit F/Vma7